MMKLSPREKNYIDLFFLDIRGKLGSNALLEHT